MLRPCLFDADASPLLPSYPPFYRQLMSSGRRSAKVMANAFNASRWQFYAGVHEGLGGFGRPHGFLRVVSVGALARFEEPLARIAVPLARFEVVLV